MATRGTAFSRQSIITQLSLRACLQFQTEAPAAPEEKGQFQESEQQMSLAECSKKEETWGDNVKAREAQPRAERRLARLAC